MIIPRILCALAAIAAVLPVHGVAEEVVQMKARRVSLFKNGYACVQMRGTLPQALQAEVKGLPLPLFGTLDWQAPEGVNITHLSARLNSPASQPGEADAFLRANAGREVALTTYNRREYRGVLVAPIPEPELPVGAFRKEQRVGSFTPSSSGSRLIVLRTSRGGIVSLSASAVASMEVVGQPHLPSQQAPAAELTLHVSEAVFGKPIQLQAVACGLSWLPTYRIELQEDGQALITGNITVINDLLDLEDVELELITGVPSLGKALITSPMVRLVGLGAFMQALSSERDWLQGLDDRGNVAASASLSRRSSYRSYDSYRARALAEVDAEWSTDLGEPMGLGGSGLLATREFATQAEELTYYTIPGFSCKRGDVVERELFSLAVPYAHVYTCHVEDQYELQYREKKNKPLADIWHCVRLTNEGKLPWSAGIVSCYSGGRFAARSMMPYIAAGQENVLRLSKTAEATLSCREELVQAGTGEKEKIDVYKGSLTLTNSSAHPMEIELRKDVYGVPDEASDGGSISVTPTYSANPRSVILWKLHLEPGEAKTCTYIYRHLNSN